MNLLHCLILSALLPFGVTKNTIPTFLIDYDQVITHVLVEQNPLGRTSASAFAEIIQDAIKNCAVLIMFVEESFCTEDISMKDAKGTPFRNLHEHLLTYKVKYIPNVVSPVKVMTRLLPPTQTNVFVLNPGDIFHPSSQLRFFYVFFDDNEYTLLNETRIEVLRRHDAVMQDVYKTTSKIANGAVIGIYTGKVNPVSMLRQGVEMEEFNQDALNCGDQCFVLASSGATFRFIGLSVNKEENTRHLSHFGEVPTIIGELRTNKTSITSIGVENYKVQFLFALNSSTWSLDHIKLFSISDNKQEISRTYPVGITAPYNHSYYCDEPLMIFDNDSKVVILIQEYQFEPQDETNNAAKDKKGKATKKKRKEGEGKGKGTDNKDEREFGKPIYCNPYFNIPILSGLLVSAFLLSVVMLGFFALYHCENNNRFDDPYGKPLIIPDYE